MESLDKRIEDRIARGKAAAKEAGYTSDEDVAAVTNQTMVAAPVASAADAKAAAKEWKANA